jgi:hypothetical protein
MFLSAVNGFKYSRDTLPAFFCIQTRDGEILVPELPDVDAVLAAPADAQLQGVIQSSIEANLQTHPQSVKAALTQGMTTLTQIEARIKADSGNINHQGIDISASHNAYIDFASGKASIEAAATAMVGDIRAVVATGNLTDVEVTPLQNVMAEIVGDAELAAEYISINLHDGVALGTEIGATAQTYVDSGNGVGDNGNVKPMPKTPQEYYTYASEIGKRADLTTAEKVHALQIVYEKLGDGNRGNLHIPAVEAFLTENGFDERGLPDYDWPDRWGMKEGTIQAIESDAHLPDIIDRDGQLAGNSASPLKENGEAYTYDEKSLPYKQNPEAKHQAVRKGQYYIELIDAIKNNDLDALNWLLNRNGIESISQDEMDQLIETYKDFLNEAQAKIKGVDVTYGFHGIADTWEKNGEVYLNGGAPQFTFPLSIEQLIQFGIYLKRR